jgi:hypothetical protein
MRGWTIAILIALAAAGCRAAPPAGQGASATSSSTAPARVATSATESSVVEPRRHGALLPNGVSEALDLAALLAEPDAHDNAYVTVQGVVRQVCQRRGCWLELASDATADSPGCRVSSGDDGMHAMTFRRDSVGMHARVEGNVHVQTVAPSRVAHMESEGGRFANKRADGSAREVSIAAIGVELRPNASP